MEREAKFYKNEYENLRRKSNKEIDRLNQKIDSMKIREFYFTNKVYGLCERFGMSKDEIFECLKI